MTYHKTDVASDTNKIFTNHNIIFRCLSVSLMRYHLCLLIQILVFVIVIVTFVFVVATVVVF